MEENKLIEAIDNLNVTVQNLNMQDIKEIKKNNSWRSIAIILFLTFITYIFIRDIRDGYIVKAYFNQTQEMQQEQTGNNLRQNMIKRGNVK